MKMNSVSKKYLELWERFSTHQDFERLMDAIKQRFNIEELRRNEEWSEQLSEEWQDALYDVLFALIPKFEYMHPEGNFLYTSIEMYLLSGPEFVKNHIMSEPFYALGIRVFDTKDKHFSKFSESLWDGVFIYIPPYISKENLSDAIKSKWMDIEKALLRKNKGKKNYSKLRHLRSHNNWERDRIVSDVYSQSRQYLDLEKDELKNYGVSRILREDYDIHVSPENVKMIVSRQKKLRAGYS